MSSSPLSQCIRQLLAVRPAATRTQTQLQLQLRQLQRRHASGRSSPSTSSSATSTTSPSSSPAAKRQQQPQKRQQPQEGKPLVLEKPERFNPPSHPARLPTKRKPKYYGPALTAAEKATQRKKQYPNMMPPEGSWMYALLTNRTLHLFISLGTLLTLGGLAFIGNFQRTTPYWDDIPPIGSLLYHPIRYLRTCAEVYHMHVAYVSEQTADRRRRNVEDVQKRAEYRKAHGLDADQGFGGWAARDSPEAPSADVRVADGEVVLPAPAVAPAVDGVVAEPGVYTDFDGKKKPIKKWLGIW